MTSDASSVSRRVRALLACGLLLGSGAMGTAALWSTSAQTVSGTFTTAYLKIQTNGSTPYSFTFPGSLLPGSSTAFLIQVQNVGSTPFTYVGSVQSASALGQATTLTSRVGGTVSGPTCTGGSGVTGQAVTGTKAAFRSTSGVLPATTGTENVCVQLTLPLGAVGTLAGSTGTVLFTFDATGV
ncbi:MULTISPECIES: hypothetical protein [Gordonia]|jgi:hypothetical protein|uniref:hypothetical protein n=1 Tax=Gordonia TaxID=2053 RepID=UPI003015AD0A